jgi:hypothetical protein
LPHPLHEAKAALNKQPCLTHCMRQGCLFNAALPHTVGMNSGQEPQKSVFSLLLVVKIIQLVMKNKERVNKSEKTKRKNKQVK